jgi:hypothetical protein
MREERLGISRINQPETYNGALRALIKIERGKAGSNPPINLRCGKNPF